MVKDARLPEAGDSIGGLVALLVSCIAEEERLLDALCLAADNHDGEAVLSLAKQLSRLRATINGSKLSVGSP